MQCLGVVFIPCFGYAAGTLLNLVKAHILSAIEGRLKAAPSGHTYIRSVVGVDAAQWRVGKRPLAGIEAIAVVNECDPILTATRRTSKYALPSIAVAQPLVEHEDAGEIGEIGNFVELPFRQVV